MGLYRIADPVLTDSGTADFNSTLYTMIQLALRDVIGGIEALEQASKGMGNTFVIGMPDEKSLKLA